MARFWQIFGDWPIFCWTLERPTHIMKKVQWKGLFDFSLYGAAPGDRTARFWEAGPERLILWFAILAIVVAVGYYVIEKIRPKPVQKEPKASQWLSKFGELHSQGGLSDEEFRTIKTNLATQLQDELNGSGEKG